MNNEYVKDIIINAIIALKDNVLETSLSDSEKNALIKLLDNMFTYYGKKKRLILSKSANSDEKLAILSSFMTDIIVKINSVLTGENDIHYFVSLMQNELQKKI